MLWDKYENKADDVENSLNNLITGDRKDYKDKLPYHQVKRSTFELISKVSQYGYQKYGCYDSWEHQEDPNVYFDAMLRHSMQHQNGELFDRESTILHIAHGLWNYQAWCYLLLRENNLIDEYGNIMLAGKDFKPTLDGPQDIQLNIDDYLLPGIRD